MIFGLLRRLLVPSATCGNCHQRFDRFADDVVLTDDLTSLCVPCAERIEAIAVAS